MADKRNDELEEVKRFVRSVLQSEKEGIPLRRFESAYDELVGESVPFRRFGYRTIVDFIAAIGDTARFEFRHNERYLTFVSSDETAHIEELVRGQKSYAPKSAPKYRYNFHPNFSRGYYNAPKPRIDYFSAPRNDSSYNGMHYANPPHNQKLPTYEPWLGVSQQQNNPPLNQNFPTVEHWLAVIQQQNNWQNIQQMSNQMLNQMRNTPPSQSYQARPPVVSTQSPIVSRTTSTSMQSNSGHKTGNNKFENFTVTRDVSNAEKSPLRVNMNEVESVVAVITTANSTLTITTITTTATAVTISSATIRPTHVNSNTTTTTAATVTPILSTTITRASESPQSLASQHMSSNSKVADEDELETSPTPPSSPRFSSMAVSNFRLILSQHKDGIPACLFAREYRKHFGVEFDSNVWGFKSAMEMFLCSPSMFAIQQPTPANENLFPGYGEEIFLHDARDKKFPVSKPKSTTDTVDLCYLSAIPDKVMAQTLKLIELNMPHGLSLTHFTEEYRINFGDIDLSQLRIPDTCQYFKLVQQVLPIEVKMIDGSNRALLKSAADMEAFLCQMTRMGRHIMAKTMIISSLPADVAMPGDVLTDLELPPHVKVGDSQYVEVLLSSARDPSNMCIQFKGDDYHSALEKLMADLDFYHTITSNIDDWRVPKALICVGLPVITKFPVDRNWHRARITQILDNQRVTVLFVDYGGITTTNIKNIFLMKRQFLSLPAQGLRVGVYGVKPVLGDKGWTANARDDLLDRFSKSHYYLACSFMEKIHSQYYLVCLCDTNDAEDVFVHEYLVQQQHAVYEDVVADSNGICAQGIDSTINLSGDTSSVLYSSSTAIQTSLTANQTLPVVQELSEEQKIIDSVNDEELKNLVQPLIPQSVSTIDSPKPVNSLNKDFNLGVNLDELRQTAEQVINEANPSQPSIQPSVTNNSTPKKLVSNITITSNLNTGERKIVNGCSHSVRHSPILNNQSLTPDDRNNSDVPLALRVKDKLDSDSIISAKLKAVLIGSQSYNLIYFMDSFFFTYSSVNEMFKDVPLWLTIRRAGGLLKDRIQFAESDGLKLFSHLNITDHLRNGTAFLYPHESVGSFAAISKLRPIRDEINSQVKLFYREILVDEKNKLLEMQRNIDNKLKNIK